MIIAVVLVGLTSFGIVFYQVDRYTQGTCQDDLITRAAQAISDDAGIFMLRPIADEISGKEFKDGDINCQYILAHYYMLEDDGNNAKGAVDKVDKLLGEGKTYSNILKEPWSVDEMRQYINELQEPAGNETEEG